jgi:hypothetical protein
MRSAIYITYEELFDRYPDVEELKNLFVGLNPSHTVLLLSRLSTMFRHSVSKQDPSEQFKFQAWFVNNFFDEETKKRLLDRFGNQHPQRRPVCHPLQLLNMMRLALTFGRATEISNDADSIDRLRTALGTASLMVNDIFCSPKEKEHIQQGAQDDRRKHLMLQILASGEISNPTAFRNLLFRSQFIYRLTLRDPYIVSQIGKECEGLNFESKFEEVVGIPLTGWLSLLTGLYTHLISHDLEEFVSNPSVFAVNRKTILNDPALSESQINSFFAPLSTNFDQLREEFRKERPVDDRFDLVPFMARPFIDFASDNSACVDVALLSEKLNNGPYFLLSSLLPENKRLPVFKAWGILFENYVNWLLEGLANRHGAVFYPNTHWQHDGNKSFDAVFVKSRLLVVMEFKSGFLKQGARYTNDVDTFMTELDSRLGSGCKQLARDVSQLLPEKGIQKQLRGVPIPSRVEWVMPILVVQDLILRAPFINYFLNQRFQSERKQFPVNNRVDVLPLNVIHISTLEDLVERAETLDWDVISLLHRRCRNDASMTKELLTFISELPGAKTPCCSTRFQQLFEKSKDEINAVLFKNDPRKANEASGPTLKKNGT